MARLATATNRSHRKYHAATLVDPPHTETWDATTSNVRWGSPETGPTPLGHEAAVDSGAYYTFTVGKNGQVKSSSYARINFRAPETGGYVVSGAWAITAVFTLPTGFYDSKQSYGRFPWTMDSFGQNGAVKLNGVAVGVQSADEVRVAPVFYNGDDKLRIQIAHENHAPVIDAWTSTSRQVTENVQHTLIVEFTPSQTTAGACKVTLDGVVVSDQSGIQTVPSSVPADQIEFTRLRVGTDGWASQQNALSARLYSVSLEAEA